MRHQKASNVLSLLKHKDLAKRLKGYQTLEAHDDAFVSIDTLLMLLMEAKKIAVPAKEKWDDPSYHLVDFVTKYATEDIFEEAIRDFHLYSSPAKARILDLLLELNTKATIEAYVSLVEEYHETIPYMNLSFFEDHTDYHHFIFPKLLSLLDSPVYRYSILHVFLYYVIDNLVDETLIHPYQDILYDEIEYFLVKMAPYQKEFKDDFLYKKYGADYFELRYPLTLLVEMLGFIPGPQSISVLKRICLTFKDKLILAVASSALIRLNQPIGQKLRFYIGENDETRSYFFEKLKRLNRLDLFPEKFATQQFLAQSSMVSWLLHPSHLGHFPTEIVPTRTIEESINDKTYRFFLFKFRSDQFSWEEKEWMFGFAGGFEKGELTTLTTNNTTSDFSSYQKETEEEAYYRLLKEVEDKYETFRNEVLYECQSGYSPLISFGMFTAPFFLLASYILPYGYTLLPIPVALFFTYIRHIRKINASSVRLKRNGIDYVSKETIITIPLTAIKKVVKEKRAVNKQHRYHLLKKAEPGFVLLDDKNEELSFIPERFVDRETLVHFLKNTQK